nr:hypothetical protein Iba_chr03bCG15130 [Ipomoea batatas]
MYSIKKMDLTAPKNTSRRTNNPNTCRPAITTPHERHNLNHSGSDHSNHHFPQPPRPRPHRRRLQLVASKENQPLPRPFTPITQRSPRDDGALPATLHLPRNRSPATTTTIITITLFPSSRSIFIISPYNLIQRLVGINSPAET